jgi:putative ABC transport system ATP-binding protein
MAIIELRGVTRQYLMGEVVVKALSGVDLDIAEGDFVAVMGPSGSGKSTLMNVLGCLDKPTSGRYVLDGLDTSAAGGDEFAAIRNTKIGFVFQGFNLLSRTTALENVELPLLYCRAGDRAGIAERARRALADVGLGDRVSHKPSQLSGGQQQRVAIARAMVNDPAFVLADEPTGNLDSETTLEVMGLFQDLNERGKTIVMVTHEPEVAAYMHRVVTLRDGTIVSDRRSSDHRSAALDLAAWRRTHAQLLGVRGGGA